MKNTKQSSSGLASIASKTLQDNQSSATAKSLAASVLSQTNTSKQTGSSLEGLASTVLQSNKYNDTTKAFAGSVLSQSNKKR
ncbi:MAG: hypothetical protein QTN59_20320 [Candidatus Electrothrix communis]|nr:hypothetical protein [Desulfobulbus sp. US4]WLE97007.1 MAG: hypothetical protein QTN59_20320 [Candidatus Electrothrix communis]